MRGTSSRQSCGHVDKNTKACQDKTGRGGSSPIGGLGAGCPCDIIPERLLAASWGDKQGSFQSYRPLSCRVQLSDRHHPAIGTWATSSVLDNHIT
jgi:hypothetical protein